MFLLSSVRVCVCVFIYKQLFVLRELSCAKLQTNLAGGGTDKCNRVWMLLNIMIFTDLAFIPLSILMSSGNCMLAYPHMRGLCWVTGIMRSQQHLVQHWFDEAYIIHAYPFTSTLFRGSTLCVTGPSLFFFKWYCITALKGVRPTYKRIRQTSCLHVWMTYQWCVWLCYWLYCTTINILSEYYCQLKHYKCKKKRISFKVWCHYILPEVASLFLC